MTSAKRLIIKLSTILLIATFQVSYATAQYKPLRIASASDLRIRHKSNNSQYKASNKKLSDRGYKRIAYIIYGQDHIAVQNVGLIIFNNTYEKIPVSKIGGMETLDSLFQVGFSKSPIELIQLSNSQKSKLTKALNARGRLHKNEDAISLFKELSQSIDAIAIIEESPTVDFLTGSRQLLAAKGIFKGISRKKGIVYAGHTVRIYDIATIKVISSGRDTQFSGDYLPFPFKKNITYYSPERLKLIENILLERYQNNVKQSFRYLKMF